MPWGTITLNDGRSLPDIAFGSATRRSADAERKTVHHLAQAIKLGFRHLDTAQQYGNEADVGEAIRLSGVSRADISITTKWSDGSMTPRQAIQDSLAKLQVDYIDLYVIHHTWTCNDDYAGAWRQMEELQREGLTRSIGLSAFDLEAVQAVVDSCTVVPAVNMIMLNPSTLGEMAPVLKLMAERGIVPGGYSSLKPLWGETVSAEVVHVAQATAEAHGYTSEQVVLRWCRAKGAIVYTSSTSSDRMERYIGSGDLELSAAEIEALDHAGDK